MSLLNRNWHIHGDDVFEIVVDFKHSDSNHAEYKLASLRFEAPPRMNYLTTFDSLLNDLKGELRGELFNVEGCKRTFDVLSKQVDYSKDRSNLDQSINLNLETLAWNVEYERAYHMQEAKFLRKRLRNYKRTRKFVDSYAQKLVNTYTEAAKTKLRPIGEVRDDFAKMMHKIIINNDLSYRLAK